MEILQKWYSKIVNSRYLGCLWLSHFSAPPTFPLRCRPSQLLQGFSQQRVIPDWHQFGSTGLSLTSKSMTLFTGVEDFFGTRVEISVLFAPLGKEKASEGGLCETKETSRTSTKSEIWTWQGRVGDSPTTEATLSTLNQHSGREGLCAALHWLCCEHGSTMLQLSQPISQPQNSTVCRKNQNRHPRLFQWRFVTLPYRCQSKTPLRK